MNEVVKNYADLDINDKRNQLNIELEIIGQLINNTEEALNIPKSLNVKNYDKNKEMSEDEFLTFLYEDVFNVERELVTFLSYLVKNKEK